MPHSLHHCLYSCCLLSSNNISDTAFEKLHMTLANIEECTCFINSEMEAQKVSGMSKEAIGTESGDSGGEKGQGQPTEDLP